MRTTTTTTVITETPPMLTVKDAARELGVSRQTVTKAIEDSKLTAVNLANGRKHLWRIPVDALQHYIAQRRRDCIVTSRH